LLASRVFVFFFQAEDGIRDFHVTGVQTCALPIWIPRQLLNRRVGVGTEGVSVAGICLLLVTAQFFNGGPPEQTRPGTEAGINQQVSTGINEGADKHDEPPARQGVVVLLNAIVHVTGGFVFFFVLVTYRYLAVSQQYP